MLRFHTQTGGVTLTAQQPLNNVVRVALQGFAAVCGGTQSLHTNGFDEALALPSERAAKLALRTQQVIALRVRRDRHRRPVRRLLLRRVADRRDRAARLGADREGRRAGRLGRGDRVHQERDRGVGLRLPRALPDQAGHRGRRQRVRRGLGRGRGDPLRRPRVRARPARAAEGVQGRARPGADRPAASPSSRRPRRAPTTCCRRSARRSRTTPPSARSAARCATSSASTSRRSEAPAYSGRDSRISQPVTRSASPASKTSMPPPQKRRVPSSL